MRGTQSYQGSVAGSPPNSWHIPRSNVERANRFTRRAQGVVFAIGVRATIRRIASGYMTPQASDCIPPIDAPATRSSFSIPSRFTRDAWLRTMSPIVNCGNKYPGWLRDVEGDVVRPFPIASIASMRRREGSSACPVPIIKSILWCVLPIAHNASAIGSRSSRESPCTAKDIEKSSITPPESSGKSPRLTE